MLYKEDWSEAQERWKAWWDGEEIAISVTAPKSGVSWEEWCECAWDGWCFCRHKTRPEVCIRQFESFAAKTYFGGVAFPSLWINLGGPVLAAYMGSEVEFKSETIWFKPVGGWDRLLDLRFDPENEHWKLTKQITEVATERGKDRFVVGMTDLGGACEALAMLRGVKNFVLDLFMRQKEVKILLEQLQDLFFYCYEEFYQIIQQAMNGISSWVGTWSPKKMFTLDHDLVVYMSPEKFRIFELPYIREECQRFDHTIYHLDGVLSFRHLDSLLSIPELNGIQWVPGAGQPGCESDQWIPSYKKVQKAGKLLVLNVNSSSKENVKHILKQLSPKGLLLQTHCHSEAEARKLLKTFRHP